jgi:hypothetical protein
MSDEEFLKRWSRRKQEAKVVPEAPPETTLPAAAEGVAAVPQATAEAEIDLSKLPPIDSIDAATDITAFLRKNIPGELSRAALRRAWAADPAIRDFVGLAENAWDFTDPTAMAGFGPLEHTPEQIASLVERVVGGVREATEKLASEIPNEAQNRPEDSETASSTEAAEAEAHPPVATTQAENEQAIAAVQPEGSGGEDDEAPIRQRLHGGALPS